MLLTSACPQPVVSLALTCLMAIGAGLRNDGGAVLHNRPGLWSPHSGPCLHIDVALQVRAEFLLQRRNI